MNKARYIVACVIVIMVVLSTVGSLGALVPRQKNCSVAYERSVNLLGPVLEVTTDKEVYGQGEPVTIIFTNVGDEILSGGGPIVTIYNNVDEIVCQDACYCWWELEPGEYFIWPPWDQTDQHGNQVPVGSYVVEGYLSGFNGGYIDTVTFSIVA